MSEHTPEPWKVVRGGGHALPSIRGADAIHTNGRRYKNGVSSASWSDEVCVFNSDLDLPGPAANAARIEAVPDLLAACEKTLTEMGAYELNLKNSDAQTIKQLRFVAQQIHCSAVQCQVLLRTAIAKAKP